VVIRVVDLNPCRTVVPALELVQLVAARVSVTVADITTLTIDVIVNAVNRTLLGDDDGVIHRVAGPELLAECRTLGGCETGEAKLASRFRLPARHVIHTVGPVWHGGTSGESNELASCYRRVLELAVTYRLRSTAFPAISCGAYGYPVDQTAAMAVREVTVFLMRDRTIERVVFVCFGAGIRTHYEAALRDAVTRVERSRVV